MNAWNLLQHWSNRPPTPKSETFQPKLKIQTHVGIVETITYNNSREHEFSSSKNLSIYRFLPQTEKFPDNSNYTRRNNAQQCAIGNLQTIMCRRISYVSHVAHTHSALFLFILCVKEHVLRNGEPHDRFFWIFYESVVQCTMYLLIEI